MIKIKADFKKTKTTDGKKLVLKIIAVVISILVLALTFLYLNNADRAARDTVRIVRVRRALPAYSVITRDDVEGYDLIRAEYDRNSMILFEDVEDVVYEKYAAYYIRESTILYIDQLTDTRPLRNEWLYTLMEDEEVFTIPYNYMEAGGNILLPGDTVRVRVHFEEREESARDAFDFSTSYQTTNRIIRTDIVFDSIVVKDMLNSNGQSIYEIYREVMRLNDSQRREVMQSSQFQSSIRPRSLVLAGMPEDITRYAAYRGSMSGGNFLITLLSRPDGAAGFDSLPTLETEVRTWIER
jgi:hypothetical protein